MIFDFSQYKRLFVFGCSFTSYIWPTWADILSKSTPVLEYYNLGKIGSGNHFISLRVSEASKRYNFTDSDIVITMWTSVTREDRYVNGKWIGDGNIFNQSLYPADFVRKFADTDYYLIRDNALINLCSGYLSTLGCKHINLFAWPVTHYESGLYTKDIADECKRLYHYDDTKTFKDFLDTQSNKGHSYTHHDKQFNDGHPTPVVHYEYLKNTGFNMPDYIRAYVDDAEKRLARIKDYNDFENFFPECQHNNKGMF